MVDIDVWLVYGCVFYVVDIMFYMIDIDVWLVYGCVFETDFSFQCGF